MVGLGSIPQRSLYIKFWPPEKPINLLKVKLVVESD